MRAITLLLILILGSWAQPSEKARLGALLSTLRNSSAKSAEKKKALEAVLDYDSPRTAQTLVEAHRMIHEKAHPLRQRIRAASRSSRQTNVQEMRAKYRPMARMQRTIVDRVKLLEKPETLDWLFADVVVNDRVHLDLRSAAVTAVSRRPPDSPEAARLLVASHTRLEVRARPIEVRRRRAIQTQDRKPVAELRRELDPIRLLQDQTLALLLLMEKPETLRWLTQNVVEDIRIPLGLRIPLVQHLGRKQGLDPSHLATRLAEAKDAEEINVLLRGLAHLGEAARGSGPAVLPYLSHPDSTVRVEAARTLAALAVPEAIEPLIERLELEEGQTRRLIIAALEVLTGQNHGPRVKAWREWFTAHGAAYAAGSIPLGQGTPSENVEATRGYYYGIPQVGHSILYVIDVSGSMAEAMTSTGSGRRRPRPAKPGETSRLDACKTELGQALGSLPEGTRFNIIYYSDVAKLYAKKLVKASGSTTRAAQKWMKGLKAEGSTNIYDALDAAFTMAGHGTQDRHYDPAVETIFLLTDGKPHLPNGAEDRPDRIRAAVRRWNPYRKVVLHTIGMGKGVNEKFLRALAEENRGRYVPR